MRALMSLSSIWSRGSCILMGIAFAIAASAAQADPADTPSAVRALVVHLDQARIIKLPERTTTLVVGNPLIADATVQPGGIIVVTGKSHGATNVVALDRTGATLMEHAIVVLSPRDPMVVVYRGVERESYSCTPECSRRITLGDSPEYFLANLTQITTLNSQAQGGGQQK
jgi:Flp pilus assembly secretin CpaC